MVLIKNQGRVPAAENTIKTNLNQCRRFLCGKNELTLCTLQPREQKVFVNLFLLLLLVCMPGFLKGQQRPLYTQYIFNNYLLNPAVGGIENYIDLKAGTRQQWVGLEDAPKTSYVSMHTPLGKQYNTLNPTSFSDRGNNPMSRSYVRDYTAADPHHGVGFHAMSDKAGIFKRVDLDVSYAYHLGLGPRLNMALGIGAGIAQINIDTEQSGPGQADDPAFINIRRNQLKPMLSAGVWFYGASFFTGLSAKQLLKQNIGQTSGQTSDLIPHYYATAGYKVPLGEELAILPSVLLTKANTILVMDMNAKVAYRNKLWIGGSYRRNDSFSGLAGLNINYLFNISYSYDFGISDMQQFNNGSHEIVLGLLLNNRYKVICPQNQF
jgi:type IX secretion system PorP/SprF family membrane protein